MDNTNPIPPNPQPIKEVDIRPIQPPQTVVPLNNEIENKPLDYTSANTLNDQKKPRNKFLISFLRFMIVGGGLFVVFVIGLGITFSACFTIKGPPPPECGPVSFVSLFVMPAASLFFLIPLSKKIK